MAGARSTSPRSSPASATGKRASVSRAITLVESQRADHRVAARELLTELTDGGRPDRGPGRHLRGAGRRQVHLHRDARRPPDRRRAQVGVLAVDPSSTRTGGSVLGDKTRMAELSANPNAYIRPSPTAGTLGGVARATTQAMLVLEAAGYDVVLVETVGVGQSEVTVAGMVDTFLFLTLARTGDQLQGIKKGILEIADVIAVNKADGDRADEARSAAKELAGALRLVHSSGREGWVPPVLTCSGLHGTDVDTVWDKVLAHRDSLGEQGLADKRAGQQLDFTWALVRDELDQRLRRSPGVKAIRDDVRRGAAGRRDSPPRSPPTACWRAYDEDPHGR